MRYEIRPFDDIGETDIVVSCWLIFDCSGFDFLGSENLPGKIEMLLAVQKSKTDAGLGLVIAAMSEEMCRGFATLGILGSFFKVNTVEEAKSILRQPQIVNSVPENN